MDFHPSVAFGYSILLYDKMFEKAKIVDPIELLEFGYPQEDQEQVLLYTGLLKTEAQVLGLNDNACYNAISLLKVMRCITKLKTGGPYSPSFYILHYKPTEEQYFEYKKNQGKLGRKLLPKTEDRLVNEMAELRSRIIDLEKAVEEIKSRISNESIWNRLGDNN